MDFSNPFVLPDSAYKRDLDLFGNYIRDTAKYLSVMTGDPFETCRMHVVETIKQKDTEFGIKDPNIVFFNREANGDRTQRKAKLSSYIGAAIKADDLIAPTLTIYENPKSRKSILVDYVDGNVKKRSAAKKAMFKAKMAGDMPTHNIKKIEQSNAKISNNSLSGAHVSSSTPLFNKTAHSTLTSTCRSTSGYGNANNEKMLNGNRHYWAPDIVRNNIISIINNTDYIKLRDTMLKWNIRFPTVQETMECIRYSAELYWRDKREYVKLERLIERLTDYERAAFVYTGDLYHLMKFNDGVVREFLRRLSLYVKDEHPDPENFIDKVVPEDYRHLAVQICADVTKGLSIDKMKGTIAIHHVASTAQNIMTTVTDYADFINTFFVTYNMPASLAYFPDSIRRAALTSDTDSTIFTVQDWVGWFFNGEIRFGNEGNAVAATMIFLAAQSIVHVLSIMSANMGIEQSRLHQIAMKNEYKFDVFVPTPVAKHYYAIIGCQEGNLYSEYDMEIKGVHLKSSNAPKQIMKKAKDMMREIMYTVVDGKKISILKFLKEVGDIERGVMQSIAQGSSDYFRVGQIKPASSYKNAPEQSPYGHHQLWNEVFGPKYGMVPEPPYAVIKVSTNLPNQTAINSWLAQMEDRELAERMQKWLDKNNRKNINTMFLPDIITQVKGIPPEILATIDSRKIILDVSKVFYLILESLGIYMLGSKKISLVSDTY